MGSVISFLVSNWGTLLTVVLGLLSVASVITKLTATPKDDEWVARIISFLSLFNHSDVGGVKAPLTAPAKPPAADEGLISKRQDL